MNKYVSKLFGIILQNQQTQTPARPPLQSLPTSPGEWRIYWQTKGFPWRTEPEIDAKRQKELSRCRVVVPDIEKGIYPFKGMKLSRADVEWLLATHENGCGPVDWSDESQRARKGLDLRGANLSYVNLSNLPLACMQGGLTLHEWMFVTKPQRDMAAVHLEYASLGMSHLEGADLSSACGEQVDLRWAYLQTATLVEAHLEEARMDEAHLEGTRFYGAHLVRANFTRAHLEGAILGRTPPEGQAPVLQMVMRGPIADPSVRQVIVFPGGADLEEAFFIEAHLEGAEMREANLKCARLWKASLEGATLINANLAGCSLSLATAAGADLTGAHLEGADLRSAHFEGKHVPDIDLVHIRFWKPKFPAILPPADLSYVTFDSTSLLQGIVLGNKEFGSVSLVGVHWGDADLSTVDWKHVSMLGDEYKAQQKTQNGQRKSNIIRMEEHTRAVRASRQLAIALENQGLNEDANRFAYRAQILQRKLLWRQKNFWKWYGSMMLAVLAGYGYRMWHIFVAYLFIILVCAGAYFVLGMYYEPRLSFLDALLTSITAFHGRVFSEPFLHPGTPQLWVTAFEAVMGLVIEGVFIAMLAQKFFGK